MKRSIALFCAVLLALFSTACGEKDDRSEPDATTSAAQTHTTTPAPDEDEIEIVTVTNDAGNLVTDASGVALTQTQRVTHTGAAGGKTSTTRTVTAPTAGTNAPAKQPDATNQTPAATAAPGTTPPATVTQPAAEPSEIKTIQLGSTVTFEGSGIATRGGRVAITKGGTYRIRGSLSDGQIEVNTTKKVTLQLDGVTLTNPNGSALHVMDAKRVTIELMDGTENALTDGGTHDADKGTIFTNDTLEITGNGALRIKAVYAHGIASDDDIILTSGNVRIESKKSGLFANDSVDVNGGTLYCNAGTNGIKCKGNVNINGGVSTLIGGTSEEKGAIICETGVLNVNGGTFYAIGNTFTPPADTSAQTVFLLDYARVQSANTLARIQSNYQNILTMTSPHDYRMVVFSTPSLSAGLSYSVFSGGSVTGGTTDQYVTSGGTYADGTRLTTFSATGRVSRIAIP